MIKLKNLKWNFPVDKEGNNLKKIVKIVYSYISVKVFSTGFNGMVSETHEMAKIK